MIWVVDQAAVIGDGEAALPVQMKAPEKGQGAGKGPSRIDYDQMSGLQGAGDCVCVLLGQSFVMG